MAIFPVAFVIADLMFDFAGFPLFRAFMNAWQGWLGSVSDPTQSEFLPVSEGAVKAATLILWGMTARYAIFPKMWLWLLPLYAVSAIVAAFAPTVIVIIAFVLLLVYVILPILNRFATRYCKTADYLYGKYYGLMDTELLNEAAKWIMWQDRFAPKDDD